MSSTCRWGFLATAAISRKNWRSIALSGNGALVAVASRVMSKADQFIRQCQAEVPIWPMAKSLGSYEALLARDDVDAVYIALPTTLRKPWVIRAAEAGKHVLCEKPIASTAADAAEMVDACRTHGVQFIDGVMFNHSARLGKLRRELDRTDGIGTIRRISSHFSFAGGEAFERDNIRTNSELEPHGCLGDLGWYNIRFTLWVMKYAMPTSVVAHSHRTMRGSTSPAEVPGELSATMFFEGGVSANFFCSFLAENQETATISGTNGYVSMEDFVLPFYDAEVAFQTNKNVLAINNCTWNMGRHTDRVAVREYASGEANSQEVNMIRTMNDLVLSGKLDDHWPQIAMKTQRVLDACRESARHDGARVVLDPR